MAEEQDRSEGTWFVHHRDKDGNPVWRRQVENDDSTMTSRSFSD